MATKIAAPEPLPGYLFPMPLGTYAGRERPLTIKVACPCGYWHRHGAGTVENPHDHPAGTITTRVGHCEQYDYRSIRVDAEPFRQAWQTRTARIATPYLRWVQLTRPPMYPSLDT